MGILTPVYPPPASGISRPSNAQGVFPSTSDINSSRVGDLDDALPDARDKTTHPPLNNTSDPNSERAQRLKAFPACNAIKEIGLKAMGQLSKSLELAEQQYLFEDLGPLEDLKKKANSDLIQNQFKTLVRYSAGVKACYKEFQALRQPFDDLASAEHTTIDQQVEAILRLGDELTKNRTALGQNANIILESKSDIWKFQDTLVKKTQEKIESVLYTEHDQQEDIQFALDMLKDGEHLLPKIKEPSGLVAAALGVAGKFGSLKVAKMYNNEWQESKMLQAAYQEEKSKTDDLRQKLDESMRSIHDAEFMLDMLEVEVYTEVFIVVDRIRGDNTQVSYVAMANKLDAAEGMLLTFVELLEEFLAQISQEYGMKFGTREAQRLCSRVPNIFTALEMLLSAKEVVVDRHQSAYEKHINDLCKAIWEHFKVMEGMHWECRDVINMERQTAFLRDDVPRFQKGVAVHLQAIKDIAETHISKAKSKEACNKRAKQDRFHGNSALAREGRPLVTGEEILWALRKVIDALLLIGVASGGNTNCTEGVVVNDSLPWFKMTREMMNEFHAVLYHETQRLESLQNKKQEGSKDNRPPNAKLHSNDKPKGRFARLLRLMTHKLR